MTMFSNNANATNGNVLCPLSDEPMKSRKHHARQQQQCEQQSLAHGAKKSLKDNINSTSNGPNSRSIQNKGQANNCDIVVVDIETEEDIYEEYSARQDHPTVRVMALHKDDTNALTFMGNVGQETIFVDDSSNNHNNKHQKTFAHIVATDIDNIVKDARGGGGHNNNNNNNHDNLIIIDDNDDDDDSLASMETLSDNVSIWIDGEKHWIAGVDAQTTCADLIMALLHYQNGQDEKMVNANVSAGTGIVSNQLIEQQPKDNEKGNTFAGSSEISAAQSSPRCQTDNTATSTSTSTATTKTFSSSTCTTNYSTGNFNQSMPNNTKEEIPKVTQNSSRLTATMTTTTTTTTTMAKPGSGSDATMLAACINSTTSSLPYPPAIATAAQLATEYVIVKQYHHCEEYLDGSTKVFDVLPPRNSPQKKECELLLRRLGPAPISYAYAHHQHQQHTATPQLSSLISTDKDSGMGSPVGSARSAKFRRRKHKSSQWLAQANTLHPKLSRCTATANERLLKIILAQDETIQRQLSLLREKERQINKIEEEKHRKRERELGKNYLLETYLNGLDEAEFELEHQHQHQHQQEGEEIFIDEPYEPQVTGRGTMPSTTTTCAATYCSTAPTHIVATHKDTLGMDILDNFRPRDKDRDNKKDTKKKKRQHKDKLIEEDEKHQRPTKEKEERLLKQLYEGSVATHIPGSVDNENSKDSHAEAQIKADVEMQIFWLEKIYTINKHLHKEEEQAAKLQAKIRKHQLRKANQTQKEVQLEMDKLDNSLALQCGNIRRVEANLMETNDQLQKKLLILERLSLEYLRQQEIEHADEQQQNMANEICTTAGGGGGREQKELNKISLSNIKSVEEVKQLQKLIAKPGFELVATQMRNLKEQEELKEAHKLSGGPELSSHQMSVAVLLHQQPQNHERPCDDVANSEGQLISASIDKPKKEEAMKTKHQTRLSSRPTTPIASLSTSTETAAAAAAAPSVTSASTSAASSSLLTTLPTTSLSKSPPNDCVVLDKNMLSSLHVQNVKTIKKQMFHAHRTTITTSETDADAAAAAITSSRSTPTLTSTSLALELRTAPTPALGRVASPAAAPNANSPQPIEIITSLGRRQQQQCQTFNQQPVQLPLHFQTSVPFHANTLTWLPNSHPASVNMAGDLPSAAASSSSSLAPIQATMAMALPISSAGATSSPASLVAMNTVDISQLGTLV
ncbi:uncharacterized protein LOC106091016 [Stomoxys calcitrans]|uniref:uncharacterized protein LOC106091016 n=1 Tax=Stomoxys calcitrans TaxID=35570 RepID=UPI0027E2F586|nr:uncharacterized protein LOC106091016 [Stomoxys calcitrans]